MSFRAMSCTATAAVVLLLAVTGCWGQGPEHRLIPHKLTDAALPCSLVRGAPNPCGPKPKFKKVPYFPGYDLTHSDCSRQFTYDRIISVDATQLTYYTQAGSIIDRTFQLKVRYVFKTATLIIETSNGDQTATRSSWALSALLDGTSKGPRGGNPAGLYATIYRQTAIQTLGTIAEYLAPFAKKNKEVPCGSYHIYNPKVAVLVAYLKQVQAILKKFKA